MDANEKNHMVSILMLPWLAHGHISPFLELAKKLSQRNVHIYFCSTPINLKPLPQILPKNIQLIELHLPPTPHLPPHYHTTKHLPPHLMPALKTAFDTAKPTFSTILDTLKPNLVIYDFIQPWAPIVAREKNIVPILFLVCGAAILSFIIQNTTKLGLEYPFHGLELDDAKKFVEFVYHTANGVSDKERFLGCIESSLHIALIKTSQEIESKYINFLSVLTGKEMVTVGPLVRDPDEDDSDAVIMNWLSKKEPSSVVFVSFGSEYFLSKDEIEETAYALELSNVGFIWVVRLHSDAKYSVHEVLPEGFVERVGDRGMVIEDWAPQAKILKHGNIGGFVSHCGWSSTLEGITFGVPIIAMPMHLDQPMNAKLVVEMGVGMEVSRRGEKFEREETTRVIREVVLGDEVRKRMKEVSKRMRDGGDEIDVVVEKLENLVKGSRTSQVSKENR